MGYTTQFDGELKFTKLLSPEKLCQIDHLICNLREDHIVYKNKSFYFQLELSESKTGVVWDGGEKCYYMELAVEYFLKELKKIDPDLSLSGDFLAQGEEAQDRWYLVVEKDEVNIREVMRTGTIQKCPCCQHEFIVE